MRNAVLLAAILFLGYTFLPARKPPDLPAGPVAEALRSASSSDRQTVASLYSALADVTERDGRDRQIGTTQSWRSCHSAALRLGVGGTSLPGKYPGLDAAVEQVLSQHFSLENLPLTDELRAKIVAGCREVAKQSGG